MLIHHAESFTVGLPEHLTDTHSFGSKHTDFMVAKEDNGPRQREVTELVQNNVTTLEVRIKSGKQKGILCGFCRMYVQNRWGYSERHTDLYTV